MDLRQYSPSRPQILAAMGALNYQPFIISDNVQTGVAYSWIHSADPRADRFWKFVFQRDRLPADLWEKAVDANARLRAMYDDFISEIARSTTVLHQPFIEPNDVKWRFAGQRAATVLNCAAQADIVRASALCRVVR